MGLIGIPQDLHPISMGKLFKPVLIVVTNQATMTSYYCDINPDIYIYIFIYIHGDLMGIYTLLGCSSHGSRVITVLTLLTKWDEPPSS